MRLEVTMKKIRYLEVLPVVFLSLLMYFVMSSPGILSSLRNILQTLLIAFLFMYIVRPIANFIHVKTKWKWPIAVLVGYVIFILVLALIIYMILPVIIDNVTALVKDIPVFITDISNSVEKFIENIQDERIKNQLELIDLTGIFNRLTSITGTTINYLTNFLMNSISALFTFILSLVISIYLLLSKNRAREMSKRIVRTHLGEDHKRRFYEFVRNADNTFYHFLSGKILDSVIIGILAFIGLLLLRAPFAPLMAFFIGLTNIIPYFGPIIGGIPAVFLTLLFDPIKAIWVGLFVLVLQQFDGNYLGPKILGNTIGIGAFWIIIGVFIGGSLFGPVGMFLGVPAIAIIYDEFDKYLKRREAKKAEAVEEIESENHKQ